MCAEKLDICVEQILDKKLLQNVEKCDNIFLVARHLCLGLTVRSGSLVKRLRHRPFTAVTRVRFP